MTTSHAVYITTNEDGIVLAASIDSPRFCVAGATEEEAAAKAQRALDFYRRHQSAIDKIAPRETRLISPAFKERELCLED